MRFLKLLYSITGLLVHLRDFALVFLLCGIFLMIKESLFIYSDYYEFRSPHSSFRWQLVNALPPLTIVNGLFCYVPFLLAMRVRQSPKEYLILSVISFVVFTISISTLWILCCFNTGLPVALGSFPKMSFADWFYVLFMPVGMFIFIAAYMFFVKGEQFEGTARDTDFKPAQLVLDCVVIFSLCFLCEIIKYLFMEKIGLSPIQKDAIKFPEFLQLIDYRRLLWRGVIVGMASFLGVYAIFLIFYRVFKSVIWFCVLSWILYLFFIILFHSAYISEDPINILFNPRLVMALFATYLLFKSYRQPSENQAAT